MVLCSVFALASCESVLDKTDLAATTPDYIYSDSTSVDLLLSQIYAQNLPAWGGGITGIITGSTQSGIGNNQYCEESYYTATTENKFIEGAMSSDVPIFSILDGTSNRTGTYGKIRAINDLIENLDKSTALNRATANRLKAQAYFFRAWRYFEMVNLYGGVPLVTKTMTSIGDEAKDIAALPRNSTTECINQIVADLDTAAKYLPSNWPSASTNWGRITKKAALAFKGRVLLHSASPLFNPSANQGKWQKAYDANKIAYADLTATGAALISDYGKIWFTEVGNTEAIMVTGYNNIQLGASSAFNNSWEKDTRPKYAVASGGGSNLPTWDLVKAYPMKDGKKAGDPTSLYPYSDALFYKNRDPRLDKTIVYNGATWSLANLATNSFGGRLWTFRTTATASPYENAGVNFSTTGFYCKKAIATSDVTSSPLDINTAQYAGTDWIEIRFAEVILNLAEAAAQIGQVEEAVTLVGQVRKRAGIEAGTNGRYGIKVGITKDEMVNLILEERQVELAFEGKRFWDMRRYKRLESLYNNNKGTQVLITLKPGKSTPTPAEMVSLPIDDLYNTYFTVTLTKDKLMSRATSYKVDQYFMPIPRTTLTNNYRMTQNNNWGGTFDPLQ